MTSFQQLVNEINKKALIEDAYMLGVDCFLAGNQYINPFEKGTQAYKDFDDGFLDSKYLQR